jgi:hypothetical protein
LERPTDRSNPATTTGLLFLQAASPPRRRPLAATGILLFVFAVAVAGFALAAVAVWVAGAFGAPTGPEATVSTTPVAV